jgi:hypothetical protein
VLQRVRTKGELTRCLEDDAPGKYQCTGFETDAGRPDTRIRMGWAKALKVQLRKNYLAAVKIRKKEKRQAELDQEKENKAARKVAREYKAGGKFWKPPCDPPRQPLDTSAMQEEDRRRIEVLREALWEATPNTRRTMSFGRKMITMAASDRVAAAFGGTATTWVELVTLDEEELTVMLNYERAK